MYESEFIHPMQYPQRPEASDLELILGTCGLPHTVLGTELAVCRDNACS